MFVVYIYCFVLNGNRQRNCGLCILLRVLGIIYLIYVNVQLPYAINMSLYG